MFIKKILISNCLAHLQSILFSASLIKVLDLPYFIENEVIHNLRMLLKCTEEHVLIKLYKIWRTKRVENIYQFIILFVYFCLRHYNVNTLFSPVMHSLRNTLAMRTSFFSEGWIPHEPEHLGSRFKFDP